MDQNQSAKSRALKRLQVGGLPLIHAIAKRMRLKEILYKYIPAHGNEDIPAVETLMLLVYNLILGKDPLYELQEWVESILICIISSLCPFIVPAFRWLF